MRRRAHDRCAIVGTAFFALHRRDRRGVAVFAKCPDEGIEFSDRFRSLTSGPLDLFGQLLELLERGLLINVEWLGFGRVGHAVSS